MARPPDDRTSRHPAFGPVSPTRGTPRRRRRSARRPVLVVVTLGVLWFALGRPTTPAGLDLPGGADDGSVAVSTGSPTADLVSPPADAEGPFPVVRVVDGDTVIVARPEGETRVRVIGIDTPESVAPDQPVECFGPEASQRAEQLLTGTSVMLRGDPTQGRVDQYGRELDYVWLADGRLFNHVMITEGFALELTFAAPYAYQADFRAAEQEAAQTEAGLWSPATCNGGA